MVAPKWRRATQARDVLEIRLQLVGGTEKLLVAQGLLFAFGTKEGFARPEVLGLGGRLQLLESRQATRDVTGLDEVGGNRDVVATLLDALGHVAHRLPHFQLEIPQEGDELADAQPQHLVQLVPFIEDKQIDVGVGVQLAAAIAPHRDQGELGPVEAELVPEPGQQRVHVFGAGGHQFDDVVTGVEALVQPGEKAAQVLLAVVTGELIVWEQMGRKQAGIHGMSHSRSGRVKSNPGARPGLNVKRGG